MNKMYEGYFITEMRSTLYYLDDNQRRIVECVVNYLIWHKTGHIPEDATIRDVIRGGLELFRMNVCRALMI